MDCLEKKLEVVHREMRLGVQFYRVENRFGHTISVEIQGQSFCCQTDDHVENEWPASPPIQDIHFEDRTDTQLLFGVGMAGQTHFSVSIESNLSDRIRFEFAAHYKTTAGFLGTTYRFLRESGSLLTEKIRPLDGATLNINSENWSVQPASTSNADFPATSQWGFDLGLAR